MGSTATGTTPYYFVPGPSSHPVSSAFGLGCVIVGASMWVNHMASGSYLVLFGLLWWFATLYRWFKDSIGESLSGQYGRKIDISYRWSMTWFIFSEVMFFGAFFTALWWARAHSLPALASLDNSILWPDFKALWPSASPGATTSPAGIVEPFQTIGPWPLPTVNTLLLLSSGVTITIAHHAIVADKIKKAIPWMWATVILGLVFLFVQGYEYVHAYRDLNLKLNSGIFGSTFFMLTGFHGFHVFVGMLMLFFITLRLQKGHFTAKNHFGFEGAAWYWHFVDVVWLGLFILVYML
jgi:cytochrome c oxidase subunit III